MIIIILLIIVIIGLIGATIYLESRDSDKAVVPIFFGIFIFIILIILSISYYTAGKRAETLNKMFGTKYTRDDLFYSKELIMKTIEGKKYRIIFEDNKKEK